MGLAVRTAVGTLTLSAAAFVGILAREGYTTDAVIPTKGDVPTVGFGTTEGVHMGDRTDPVRAAQRALKDASTYEGALKACVHAPLSQAEYDLYVDLSYNIGSYAFCSSQIVKDINAYDYLGACEQILAWKKFKGHDCSDPNGHICPGIWADRLKKHAACVAAQ